MFKQPINIVWFKRDLRLQDHEPLLRAAESSLPVLLIYFFEPTVMTAPDSDERHWRFVQESIADLNRTLHPNGKIYGIQGEVVPSLRTLTQHFSIQQIFSHEETGNAITYQRDKDVAAFCREYKIDWRESPTNGIVRRLYHRTDFTTRWLSTMEAGLYSFNSSRVAFVELSPGWLPAYTVQHTPHRNFQPGGVTMAYKYLNSFLYDRKSNYSRHISKPELSRTSCSRLSPYLAWGNLSMKQVYQATRQALVQTGDKRNLSFFIARLHWHCHFIQKFETECRMEFENLNSGFDHIRQVADPARIHAWEIGRTGYPLVDACIRCVTETGYLNFRMRSMLVSFFTHHLWQPWQAGTHFLARQFLDYEPGIHYPQFQMQAGTMGVNTIRIYNPVKQSQDHDPDGLFIKKWLPELTHVSKAYIHEPWHMTEIEQAMYQVKLGQDYPLPVVDIAETGRHAREQLWKTKKSVDTKTQNERILKRHTKRKTEKEETLTLPL